MLSNQRKVVYKTLVEIAAITSIAPLIFAMGGDAIVIILIIQGFNAALNIVAYEYAIRGYFSAQFLSETLDKLKAQVGGTTVKPEGRLRRWLSRRRR